MLLLSWLGCLDVGDGEGCPGEDPVPLYGTQRWEGPAPAVLSLVTWGGPGRVCEVTCDQGWVHPGYIWEHEPCHEGRLELELTEDEWAGMCAFLDVGAVGEAVCTVELPSGPVDFEIVVLEDDAA